MWVLGIRATRRARCSSRILWCSAPESIAAFPFASQCNTSRQSHAEFRHRDIVGVSGSQHSSDDALGRGWGEARGVQELICICSHAMTSFVLRSIPWIMISMLNSPMAEGSLFSMYNMSIASRKVTRWSQYRLGLEEKRFLPGHQPELVFPSVGCM